MPENVKTFRLDGADYEIPVQVEKHIESLRADSADLEDKLSTAKAETETVQAKLDSAQDEVKSLKEQLKPEAIQARVDSRLDLLDRARGVCGDEIKTDMADSDVMETVIKKVFPEAKLDGKSSDYITARFDSAIDAFSADSVASQHQEMNTVRNDNKDYVSRYDKLKGRA